MCLFVICVSFMVRGLIRCMAQWLAKLFILLWLHFKSRLYIWDESFMKCMCFNKLRGSLNVWSEPTVDTQ